MTQSFDAALEAFTPALPLAVGLSGGADSTALLLACAQRWPGQVYAIHIHHGLQAAADDFEQHCRAVCQRWHVPLQVQRVDARPAPGQSPEDAARQARYQALEAAAAAATATATATSTEAVSIASIALAHHADDQVETLLLALSRGAGLSGLAAMPSHWQRAGLAWYRPLLCVSSTAVRDWLRMRGQGWIEDPTNRDERYTRNRIRAHVLPALQTCFAHFRDTFARSSAHAAQAQTLLEEIAQQDYADLGEPPRLTALRALGYARQANVLRYWLRHIHHTTPSSAQLAQLQQQLQACRTRGHQINLKIGRGLVRRNEVYLVFLPSPAGDKGRSV